MPLGRINPDAAGVIVGVGEMVLVGVRVGVRVGPVGVGVRVRVIVRVRVGVGVGRALIPKLTVWHGGRLTITGFVVVFAHPAGTIT